jgi:hypothetical protein
VWWELVLAGGKESGLGQDTSDTETIEIDGQAGDEDMIAGDEEKSEVDYCDSKSV